MKKQLRIKWKYLALVAFTIIVLTYLPSWAKDAELVYKQAVKVQQLLKTTTTSIGQPIDYTKIKQPEVTALKVEIPPGKETGWHKHPFPGYGHILQGVLTLEIEGDRKLILESGSTFVEVVNTLHNGKNLGKEPVNLIVFFTGEAGEAITIPMNKKE